MEKYKCAHCRKELDTPFITLRNFYLGAMRGVDERQFCDAGCLVTWVTEQMNVIEKIEEHGNAGTNTTSGK